jgi:hypothetical protein
MLTRHLSGVRHARTDVVGFESGVLLEDLFDRQAIGEEVDDEGYPDPMAANARLAVADGWVRDDPFEELLVCHASHPGRPT